MKTLTVEQLDHISLEFFLRAYIRLKISPVSAKYSYPNETSINPAFQRIEDIEFPLALNEKRLFALRSDLVLATGIKNAYQEYGYSGLSTAIESKNHHLINWEDRYGHPSLAFSDNQYDGRVFYAGFICQRATHLEIFLSSGRFNRFDRTKEEIQPLTSEQRTILESYLTLKFTRVYGSQSLYFYDTQPGQQDDEDSALFFSDLPFPKTKCPRIYTTENILKAVELARQLLNYPIAQSYIQNSIAPVKPKYQYDNEGNINPAFQNIEQVNYPLQLWEKRIWVLRTDFILALGVKNAYQKEYDYHGLAESFSDSLHSFLNWNDRYGHPSLTLPEGDYDGSAFYAGYLCQRKGFLQVYLVSGRFDRTDLDCEKTQILEAYIASLLQVAYGLQDIVFDYGNPDNPKYHQVFFGNGVFDKKNPQRRYSVCDIEHILQEIPCALNTPVKSM
ncbi:hypothetical protein [Legionella hackeliae]|uniref:Uncharacterized protein n=1 Tax=Legionella hackeliae TaxID=449 RepID=A0A0A8UM93_LEGHA|nr:hypothetical protein [Legionella hackeliae]KTD10487.1 hypothetical protein Lhac_2855 [Legionella hackeliae]CEK09990.1 conserved protein of unknown function [Legionella hackeliae]STX49907.1 Uncharacterised protein [Legionella hackeliae]